MKNKKYTLAIIECMRVKATPTQVKNFTRKAKKYNYAVRIIEEK